MNAHRAAADRHVKDITGVGICFEKWLDGVEVGSDVGAAAERIKAVVTILNHRFPDADERRMALTVDRLTAGKTGWIPGTAVADALALGALDS